MSNDYLDKLNEQQRAAVEYCDGPQLVIAGAGSGKTRVLTYKIVHLLHCGHAPWRIMALTFTNKAAREMRQRIEALVGEQVAGSLQMGTFHSVFARFLRVHAERIGYPTNYTIYDTADSRSLIKRIIKEMGLDDKVYRPATLQAHISNMKNALITPDLYIRNAELLEADQVSNRPETANIYAAYCNRCRIAGAMDFDDLLLNTCVLLRDCPDVLRNYQERFTYILVDEYQDTNFAQHLIVHQISRLHNRITVVGDDAQSIYSFRGANIDNILNLNKVYPDLRIFKLEQNYRSTKSIINAANSLIEKNEGQIAKHLFSENDTGERIRVTRCLSDYDEAYAVANQITAIKARQGCSYEDFAILYRVNAQSRVLEEALSNGGRKDLHGNVRAAIPYRIYGGTSFYQRKEVKDAICYLRLVVNPHDDEALRRIINYPTRGIGESTIAKVTTAATGASVSLWQVVCDPERYKLAVHKGTLAKLQAFATLIQGFIDMNSQGANALEITEAVIERSRIKAVLLGDMTPENISRSENIDELANAVHDFVDEKQTAGDENCRLEDFLAETSLLTDQDQSDPDGEKVTLMTVHAAKGLEFKNVFIVGVEEDLFPAALSADTLQGIEEERRLFYVAITRAKTLCNISYATSRYLNGSTKQCVISRFINDIDPKFLQMDEPKQLSWDDGFKSLSNVWRSGGKTFNDFSKPTAQEKILKNPRPQESSKEGILKNPMHPLNLRVRDLREIKPHETGNGKGFSTHVGDELSIGCRINHQRFGLGTVMDIDKATTDTKIIVDFDNAGTKTLLLKFAKFQIL